MSEHRVFYKFSSRSFSWGIYTGFVLLVWDDQQQIFTLTSLAFILMGLSPMITTIVLIRANKVLIQDSKAPIAMMFSVACFIETF